MPPTRSRDKLTTSKMDKDEPAPGHLTTADLESTLSKFFNEAEKKSQHRFEHLESQLGSIQKTLATHSRQIEEQRATVTALQDTVESNVALTSKLEDKVSKLENKITQMEDRSRRCNLRIMHLQEGEEKNNALSYLSAALPSWLPGLADDPPELMRAHRIGPPRASSAPQRAMVVQCLRFTDRDRILNEARKTSVKVAGHTLQFAPDFSDFTAKLRRPCYPIMHRARTLGLQAFLLYPATIKITSRSGQHLFESPSAAEKFISDYEKSKTA